MKKLKKITNSYTLYIDLMEKLIVYSKTPDNSLSKVKVGKNE
ncbi:hypothetical protein LPA07_31020 [Lactiplantibacillus paraplantarum]|jgi:hypothetical protein|nr:hypothetical protein LPA07_31020 [Lactiplantibacillus paraplantarum]